MNKRIDEDQLMRLVNFRKSIHAQPELSMHEFMTSNRIKQYLQVFSKAEIHTIIPTGVVAVFDSGKPGKSILIRGDIDALPIDEVNTFEYRSKVDGISHKCGHDGHLTILLGLAEVLSNYPIDCGKVYLLFQPGEEDGAGAKACIESSFFKDLSLDFVFALHNLPGFEMGEIVIKEDAFNANVRSMIIQLNGKTAHAAEPEMGNSPALMMAELLQFAEELTNNQPAQNDFFLITPIHLNMGEIAYGIAAGKGELHLTIRSWNLEIFERKLKEYTAKINELALVHQIEVNIDYTQSFLANINDVSANQIIKDSAQKQSLSLREMSHGFKWGEDFGIFTQRYKGAMFGLGAGINQPALHNPDYDFPDDLIEIGIHQFYEIIQSSLSNS